MWLFILNSWHLRNIYFSLHFNHFYGARLLFFTVFTRLYAMYPIEVHSSCPLSTALFFLSLIARFTGGNMFQKFVLLNFEWFVFVLDWETGRWYYLIIAFTVRISVFGSSEIVGVIFVCEIYLIALLSIDIILNQTLRLNGSSEWSYLIEKKKLHFVFIPFSFQKGILWNFLPTDSWRVEYLCTAHKPKEKKGRMQKKEDKFSFNLIDPSFVIDPLNIYDIPNTFHLRFLCIFFFLSI